MGSECFSSQTIVQPQTQVEEATLVDTPEENDEEIDVIELNDDAPE